MTENEPRPSQPHFENVCYAVHDRIATVVFDRPDQLNSMTLGPGGMHRELLAALTLASEDDGVGCVVVTGAGRAFCAGGNMASESLPKSAIDWHRLQVGFHVDNERIRDLRKPVIGAINGLCYGAGLMVACHFDFLIAHENARFGLIETRFGSGGADVLAYLVGPQWAKFMAITGELVGATKAKEIGLVLDVFPEETFRAKVDDLARRIAAMPPNAVVLNRWVVNGAMRMMGWSGQKDYASAINGILNSTLEDVATADGRTLAEIHRTDGWDAYKRARDRPFSPPWLDG